MHELKAGLGLDYQSSKISPCISLENAVYGKKQQQSIENKEEHVLPPYNGTNPWCTQILKTEQFKSW